MKPNVIRLFVVLVVVLLTSFAQAQDKLVLYDNFRSRLINPDKWYGNAVGAGREVFRGVQNQELRMMDRVYGSTDKDSGDASGNVFLNFMVPTGIHTIKATVSAANFKCVGCDANPNSLSYASAHIQGNFFNAGTSVAGNQTNDIRARIGIGANTNTSVQPQEMKVFVKIQKCENSDCSKVSNIFGEEFGAVPLSQKVALYVKWDETNRRFLFRRDLEPWFAYYFSETEYPVISAPGGNNKQLVVSGTTANCTGSPRPMTYINAYFDDIYINQVQQ